MKQLIVQELTRELGIFGFVDLRFRGSQQIALLLSNLQSERLFLR
jgi:hypothetical protein